MFILWKIVRVACFFHVSFYPLTMMERSCHSLPLPLAPVICKTSLLSLCTIKLMHTDHLILNLSAMAHPGGMASHLFWYLSWVIPCQDSGPACFNFKTIMLCSWPALGPQIQGCFNSIGDCFQLYYPTDSWVAIPGSLSTMGDMLCRSGMLVSKLDFITGEFERRLDSMTRNLVTRRTINESLQVLSRLWQRKS